MNTPAKNWNKRDILEVETFLFECFRVNVFECLSFRVLKIKYKVRHSVQISAKIFSCKF
jgi:hypothetical protein